MRASNVQPLSRRTVFTFRTLLAVPREVEPVRETVALQAATPLHVVPVAAAPPPLARSLTLTSQTSLPHQPILFQQQPQTVVDYRYVAPCFIFNGSLEFSCCFVATGLRVKCGEGPTWISSARNFSSSTRLCTEKVTLLPPCHVSCMP